MAGGPHRLGVVVTALGVLSGRPRRNVRFDASAGGDEMHLTTKDRIASVMVLTAVVAAAAWFIGVPGVRSLDIRGMTVVVLAIGMPLSAAAVVPGFDGLIHGSRAYLLSASALGLIALVSAILTLVNATEQTFVALVALLVVLWAMATARHSGAIGTLTPPTRI